MSYLQAIILGLVQGITEFLPVSSSGHLAILQSFFGLESTENHLLFDVLLHLGTLGAVLITYWGDIAGLTREGLVQLHLKKPRRGQKPDPLRQRMILFILLATLPLVLVVFLRKAVTSLYENTFFIGFALLVPGGLLFAADRMGHGNKTEKTNAMRRSAVSCSSAFLRRLRPCPDCRAPERPFLSGCSAALSARLR